MRAIGRWPEAGPAATRRPTTSRRLPRPPIPAARPPERGLGPRARAPAHGPPRKLGTGDRGDRRRRPSRRSRDRRTAAMNRRRAPRMPAPPAATPRPPSSAIRADSCDGDAPGPGPHGLPRPPRLRPATRPAGPTDRLRRSRQHRLLRALVEHDEPVDPPELSQHDQAGTEDRRPDLERHHAKGQEYEAGGADRDEHAQHPQLVGWHPITLLQPQLLAVNALRRPACRVFHRCEDAGVQPEPDDHRRDRHQTPPAQPHPAPDRQDHQRDRREPRPHAPRDGMALPGIVGHPECARDLRRDAHAAIVRCDMPTSMQRSVTTLTDMSDAHTEVQSTYPPSPEFAAQANATEQLYREADEDRLAFWAKQANRLSWDTPFDEVLDWSGAPVAKWFVGGKLNVAYNCVDRHVEAGNGERVAYHWRGEEGEELEATYNDLYRDVQKFANALKDLGVAKGDVVAIYLPMIPEVAVAMLACARIGAIHNVVFGGFSAESVKERIEFSEAKTLITVDGARRKGKTAPIKEAVDACMPDLPCIVVQHTNNDAPMADKDAWYHEVMEAADAECAAEPLDAEYPLYVLYTSGSTAKPKGILHTTGGCLTQVAWTHKNVFDLKPEEDVYWCSADVGWVTGHSYIVYGPLLNGATSVMWEGAPDYPDKDIWWEICEKYGVTIFYTSPTAIRACMKWGAEHPHKHDLSSIRLLGSVGEP